MEVKRFTHQNKDLLAKAFEIREKVFVHEQEVDPSEEFDEFENSSIHYVIISEGKAVATARWRITSNGIKLERFAVLKEERGKSFGDRILKSMLTEIPRSYEVYMHAQVHVIPFYEKNGFEKVGSLFSECNIHHYKMVWKNSQKADLSLRETINHVNTFHDAFGLYIGHAPNAHVDKSLIDLRYKLMHEENEEYLEAARDGDLVEIADALGDMLYILCGTIITHGMQHKIAEVYNEIQRSNMSKLDSNGKPIYRNDGKVLKSDLYFKPDIASILGKD